MKNQELKNTTIKIFLEDNLSLLHSRICAETIINAELVGSYEHGLSRLKMYCNRIKKIVINYKI